MEIEKKVIGTKSFTERTRRVLVVDPDRDRQRRKERIDILKRHDLKIFPARDMGLARGRCTPGAFDLVLVYAGADATPAQDFCAFIKQNGFVQPVLLVVPKSSNFSRQENVVEDDPAQLLAAIHGVFRPDEEQELPAVA